MFTAPLSKGAVEPRVLTGADIAREVERRVLAQAAPADATDEALEDLALETLYSEEKRLEHGPSDPRTASDRVFAASLRRAIGRPGAERRSLATSIVRRYVEEISGHFDPRVYAVATRVLPRALGGLLGGLEAGRLHFDLDTHVRLEGEVDALRRAATRGTVVLVPTHVSNLDSPLVGWAIYRLGLPPFAYAAGLNLFTSALIGYFMRNLGAYTVDRKKTDPLYRLTLKEYTTTLLSHGQHGLWFPGATRSRSGAIESRLKLGLLGTVPEAFRRSLEESPRRRPRIFVVPCTITYPLVLEASSLVRDFLECEGRARYLDRADEFERPAKWLVFMRSLRNLDLRVHVRFAAPIDPVGNDVDLATGESVTAGPRAIDPAGYFTAAGRVSADPERDAEYTRMLSARVLRAYRRDTVAMPTSVVAYAAFERARGSCEQPDLFRLLRMASLAAPLAESDIVSDVEQLQRELDEHQRRGDIVLDSSITTLGAREIVDRALATFATYHAVPALERAGGGLAVRDASLLFYYRNRLEGRGLLGARS